MCWVLFFEGSDDRDEDEMSSPTRSTGKSPGSSSGPRAGHVNVNKQVHLIIINASQLYHTKYRHR